MTDPAERVIIRHEDGRSYSVTRKAFSSLYEDEGFEIVGDETPEAFVADVPERLTRAGARRKTGRTAKPTRSLGADES